MKNEKNNAIDLNEIRNIVIKEGQASLAKISLVADPYHVTNLNIENAIIAMNDHPNDRTIINNFIDLFLLWIDQGGTLFFPINKHVVKDSPFIAEEAFMDGICYYNHDVFHDYILAYTDPKVAEGEDFNDYVFCEMPAKQFFRLFLAYNKREASSGIIIDPEGNCTILDIPFITETLDSLEDMEIEAHYARVASLV